MPKIFTGGMIPYFAGRSLGQIEAEQESYRRGVEKARLNLQARATQQAQQERELARRYQERQSLIKQQQYGQAMATEAERYEKESATEETRYQEGVTRAQTAGTQRATEFKETLAQRKQEFQMKDILAREKAAQPKKLSETGEFHQDLRNYEAGEVSKEEIIRKYPWQRKQIGESTKTIFSGKQLKKKPLELKKRSSLMNIFSIISPSATVGKAIAGKRKEKANKETIAAAKEIKTYNDLIELYENQEVLENMGVDTWALLNHYEAEMIELSTKGLIKE